MCSFNSTLHISVYPAMYSVMTLNFLYCKIRKTEIYYFLVEKLQFEAQTLHTTDSAEGVEADESDIEVDEGDEDVDGLDEVEVEDQAESGSLYESQTETETETETEDENGDKPKGLEHSFLMCSLL